MESQSNNLSSSKESYRTHLKKVRSSLSPARRERARHAVFIELLPPLAYFNHVLSFASFGHEIDTSWLNHFLARTGRLLLPKIEGETLKIFKIESPEEQLIPNAFGLYEPSPQLCEEVAKEAVEIVLVPALGFDHDNHRIGYGQGYYDRFLKNISPAKTLGVGFKEQLVLKLPTEPTDVSLEKVSLF